MARVACVLRIDKIIVLFSDTSMKFSMQVEFSLRNILARAIQGPSQIFLRKKLEHIENNML